MDDKGIYWRAFGVLFNIVCGVIMLHYGGWHVWVAALNFWCSGALAMTVVVDLAERSL